MGKPEELSITVSTVYTYYRIRTMYVLLRTIVGLPRAVLNLDAEYWRGDCRVALGCTQFGFGKLARGLSGCPEL
jgi:hypothetical protein